MPDEDDKIVLTLLFELATFHALAKLRLHTETTILDLEGSTTRLGECMRRFEKFVCSKYNTKELPSELAARTRRQQRKALQKPTTTPAPTRKDPATKGPQQRKFNLETYKYHALGDYAISIRLHGPLDGYSSQLVSYPVFSMGVQYLISDQGELEHCRSKRFYPIVRKGSHAVGIGKAVSRERLLQQISQRSIGSTHPKV